MPKVLAMRSLEDLEMEIAACKQAEAALREANAELERRLLEQTNALQESEVRHRLLVELTPDAILLKIDHKIVYANAAAVQLLGHASPEELCGRPYLDFVHPDFHTATRQVWQATFDRGDNILRMEQVWLRSDGSLAEVETTAYRFVWRGELHVKIIARDISDRNRREREFATLVENSPDVVFRLDRELRYLYINPAVERATGLQAQRFLGVTGREAGMPEDIWRPFEAMCRQALRTGRPERMEFVYPTPQGPRYYESRIVPEQSERRAVVSALLGVMTDLTERKQVEEKLRLSETEARRTLEVNQTIMTNMGEGLYTLDVNGCVTYLNPAAERLFGWASAELLGRRIHEVTHYQYPDGTLFPIGNCPAYRALREGTLLMDQEDSLLRKDGSFFPVIYSASPLRSEGRLVGQVVVFRDLTPQKRAQEALQFLAEAGMTLGDLLDVQSTARKIARLAVPFLADWCVVDMVGDGGRLSRMASAHADPAREELLTAYRTRYTLDWNSPNPVVRVLKTGQSEMVPEVPDAWIEAICPDGEQRRLLRKLAPRSLIVVPLAARGRILGAVSFLRSNGRRYGADDLDLALELARRAASAIDNARLYHEVREADRRKDEFLATLAHELRNPLAPIRNGLQILSMAGDNKTLFAEMRDMLERQVEQMVRLVDDLLDVSRITRGKIELRQERLELSAVVQSALETSRPLIEAAHHHLTVSLPPEPLVVFGDLTRLAQVLSNLLNNAAKYTPDGGHIWLSVERDAQEAVLRVRDDGIGIPEEMQQQAFEMFMQMNRSQERTQGGLGIGLTLVRSLTEKHGGSVVVRSDGMGKGSEFTVRLPLAPEAPQTLRLQQADQAPEMAPLATYRIMVVDDNVDSAQSLGTLLKLHGAEVRIAYDGLSALETATAFVPDVVLLDIGMPGMDGYEVARRLRALPHLETAVLVAQTGWGQEEDRRRSEEAGCDYHLVKPIDLEALEELLAQLSPKSF